MDDLLRCRSTVSDGLTRLAGVSLAAILGAQSGRTLAATCGQITGKEEKADAGNAVKVDYDSNTCQWWAGNASPQANDEYCVHCRRNHMGVTRYTDQKLTQRKRNISPGIWSPPSNDSADAMQPWHGSSADAGYHGGRKARIDKRKATGLQSFTAVDCDEALAHLTGDA